MSTYNTPPIAVPETPEASGFAIGSQPKGDGGGQNISTHPGGQMKIPTSTVREESSRRHLLKQFLRAERRRPSLQQADVSVANANGRVASLHHRSQRVCVTKHITVIGYDAFG